MEKGFIKIYRQLLEWEWYDDNNMKILFLHLLLKANWEDKKWRGKIIKRGTFITSLQQLSNETHLSIMQIRTCIKKLKVTNEITVDSTTSFTLIRLNNYSEYQKQDKPDNKPVTNEQQNINKQVTITKEYKNNKNIKNNKITIINNTENTFSEVFKNSSESKKSNISISTENGITELTQKEKKVPQKKEKEEFGNAEINKVLKNLTLAVGVDEFKEVQKWQRIYGRHFINLIKKIGREEFILRLKGIMKDSFKSKNANSLKYLYGEVKAFIHTETIEKTSKRAYIKI